MDTGRQRRQRSNGLMQIRDSGPRARYPISLGCVFSVKQLATQDYKQHIKKYLQLNLK